MPPGARDMLELAKKVGGGRVAADFGGGQGVRRKHSRSAL